MQQAARFSGGLSRVAMIGIATIMLVGFAAAIAYDKRPLAVVFFAMAALPFLLYVCGRWPMAVPFGFYPVTVPFDELLKVSGGAGGAFAKMIGIATMVALLFHAFRMRRLNAPTSGWYFWAAYLFYALLGWMWSPYPDDVAGTLQIVGSLFALYTIFAVYPVSAQGYVFARRAVVFAGAFTAFYGIYAYAGGQRLGNARLALTVNGAQIDPNHYAAFFAIPIGILAARLFCVQSMRDRIIAGVLVIPMFVNILLTGSRGGLIASGLMFVYLGIRARKFVALGATAVVGVLSMLAVPNVLARFFDPTSGDAGDASGRTEIWTVGFAALKTSGFFGSGFGTFADMYDDNIHLALQKTFAGYHRPAHSILIETMVDLGVPGLILLFAGWWMTLRQNAWLPRTSYYFMDAIGYEAAVLGIFISALTIDLMWFKYPWLAFMMVALLANVVRPRLLVGRPPAVQRQRAMPRVVVREHVRL